MEPVSIDLRFEGRAALMSIAQGLDGVAASADGDDLVLHVTAPTLREAQVLFDAAMAALSEGESTA